MATYKQKQIIHVNKMK